MYRVANELVTKYFNNVFDTIAAASAATDETHKSKLQAYQTSQRSMSDTLDTAERLCTTDIGTLIAPVPHGAGFTFNAGTALHRMASTLDSVVECDKCNDYYTCEARRGNMQCDDGVPNCNCSQKDISIGGAQLSWPLEEVVAAMTSGGGRAVSSILQFPQFSQLSQHHRLRSMHRMLRHGSMH